MYLLNFFPFPQKPAIIVLFESYGNIPFQWPLEKGVTSRPFTRTTRYEISPFERWAFLLKNMIWLTYSQVMHVFETATPSFHSINPIFSFRFRLPKRIYTSYVWRTGNTIKIDIGSSCAFCKGRIIFMENVA